MPKFIVTCKDELTIYDWKCNQPYSVMELKTCIDCDKYVLEDEYCTATKIFGRVVGRPMSPTDYCSKWVERKSNE